LPFGKTYQVLNSFSLDHFFVVGGTSGLVAQLPESLALLLNPDPPKAIGTLLVHAIQLLLELLLLSGRLLVPSVLLLLAVEGVVIVRVVVLRFINTFLIIFLFTLILKLIRMRPILSFNTHLLGLFLP
jgi:hypothetical protein